MNPAPGTRVRPGSTITLNVVQTKKDKKKDGNGDNGAQLPDVVGQTLANAAQTLRARATPTSPWQGSRDPNAIVVDQQPSGGAAQTPPQRSP